MLYGIICVPTIGVIMAANADLLNDKGGTDNVALLLQIEAIQAIVLLATGFVVAWIARFKEVFHVLAATGLMMLIGVMVQVSAWDSVPPWHHFVFFGLILFLVPLGGYLNERIMGSSETVSIDVSD